VREGLKLQDNIPLQIRTGVRNNSVPNRLNPGVTQIPPAKIAHLLAARRKLPDTGRELKRTLRTPPRAWIIRFRAAWANMSRPTPFASAQITRSRPQRYCI